MRLKCVIPFAHDLLRQATKPGDIAIDATVGNGHDTEVLAKLVGKSGLVFGFDVQEQAIAYARAKVSSNVQLFPTSHEYISKTVPAEYHGQVASCIFNLGYLPGGDKSITTHAEATIAALQQLLTMLKQNGIIVLVVYHGHPEGKRERDALLSFVAELDQKKVSVLKYEFLNQIHDPPFVLALEKNMEK